MATKTKKSWNKGDVGCYADDCGGEKHIREVLAGLVEPYGDKGRKLAEELRGEPSDDASEDYEALDLLNEDTVEGIHWELDGGLFLLKDEEVGHA